jgi:hypothetical protein
VLSAEAVDYYMLEVKDITVAANAAPLFRTGADTEAAKSVSRDAQIPGYP